MLLYVSRWEIATAHEPLAATPSKRYDRKGNIFSRVTAQALQVLKLDSSLSVCLKHWVPGTCEGMGSLGVQMVRFFLEIRLLYNQNFQLICKPWSAANPCEWTLSVSVPFTWTYVRTKVTGSALNQSNEKHERCTLL